MRTFSNGSLSGFARFTAKQTTGTMRKLKKLELCYEYIFS
jgi:hypothetical protein